MGVRVVDEEVIGGVIGVEGIAEGVGRCTCTTVVVLLLLLWRARFLARTNCKILRVNNRHMIPIKASRKPISGSSIIRASGGVESGGDVGKFDVHGTMAICLRRILNHWNAHVLKYACEFSCIQHEFCVVV